MLEELLAFELPILRSGFSTLHFLQSTLYFLAGGQKIGVTGFEPATSASRTKLHSDENPVNHGVKCDDAERLHQCLHQIGQLIESYGPETLADALAELLGVDGPTLGKLGSNGEIDDRYERLADAIGRRVAKG